MVAVMVNPSVNQTTETSNGCASASVVDSEERARGSTIKSVLVHLAMSAHLCQERVVAAIVTLG